MWNFEVEQLRYYFVVNTTFIYNFLHMWNNEGHLIVQF